MQEEWHFDVIEKWPNLGGGADVRPHFESSQNGHDIVIFEERPAGGILRATGCFCFIAGLNPSRFHNVLLPRMISRTSPCSGESGGFAM
jgi:hypothetical protein